MLKPQANHGPHRREGTLIFIPSYFDFVRLRNHLNELDVSFVGCSEYTTDADISRARSDFYHRRVDLFVCTERFHYFRRYRIRGVLRVVWYGLPDHAEFYAEMVDCLGTDVSASSSSTAIFSKWDALRLARIVGSKRCPKMLSAVDRVFRLA